MAGWKELAAALAAMGGMVHPGGHLQEANKLGDPGSVDYKTLTEGYKKPLSSLGPEGEMAVQGAGFKAQDDVARMLEDPKAKEAAYLANAILKGSYASGLSDRMSEAMGGGFADRYGDLGAMNRISGTKAMRPAMGFAALMDLYKSQHPNQNWDVSVGPMERGVGATFTTRW